MENTTTTDIKMDYAERLIGIYENLIELQQEKRRVLTTREIDLLGSVDEKIVSFYNQALDISQKRELVKPNENQVKKINELYEQMNTLEKINQAIVEQSLYLINKIFTGMMRLVKVQPEEYTKTGKTNDNEDYRLSSISEEA